LHAPQRVELTLAQALLRINRWNAVCPRGAPEGRPVACPPTKRSDAMVSNSHICSPARCTARLFATSSCAALLLAGCGGGGGSSAFDAATLSTEDSAAARLPAAAPASRIAEGALPSGYTMHFIDVPLEALQIFADPHGSSINVRGEVIGYGLEGHASLFDAEGHTVAQFFDPAAPTHFFHAESLSDRSAVAGSTQVDDPSQRPGWYWAADTGLRQFTPSSIVNHAFIADDGLVVGRMGESDQGCGAFFWSPATSALTELADFCARALTHAGIALGTRQGRVATLARDGSVEIVAALDGQSAEPVAMSDDAQILVNLREPIGQEVATHAAVASGGEAVRIGEGVFALPAGARRVSEQSLLLDGSRAGHAIGTDSVRFELDTLPDGTPCLFTSGGFQSFYWTQQDGAVAVEVAGAANPASVADVNAQGIVVGEIFDAAGASKPFVWSKVSGGVMLESLVTNLPQGAHLVGPLIVIGDGGHVLSYVVSDTPDTRPRGFVILTPNQP
jgi:hypothetical protein